MDKTSNEENKVLDYIAKRLKRYKTISKNSKSVADINYTRIATIELERILKRFEYEYEQ